MNCTIFEDLFTVNKPYIITVDAALQRIKTGKSKAKVEAIRNCIDKERQDALKKQLPSVCFSGEFTKRGEDNMTSHNGFLVLDFDNVNSVEERAAEIASKDFIYALWLSPRGNGLKALVKIADGTKHREHFRALQETFPEIDASGKDPSRVCFESYDPNIYINTNAKVFTKLLTVTKVEQKEIVNDDRDIFKRLLTWLSNKNHAFQSGERNIFIFRLASACCRFGIADHAAEYLIQSEFPTSNDFTLKELNKAIQSAYIRNKSNFGTAHFEFDTLVDKKTLKEVEIKQDDFNPDEPAKDVVYGEYVKQNALDIYRYGYVSVRGLNVPQMDYYFKEKKGEVTCLTGIGNYGKSTFYKWRMLMRILQYGEKFATFAPEDNPPEEYYHDFVEMLCGCDCTPQSQSRPSIEVYDYTFDFIAKHLFYIRPNELSPSPTYIKERFLELIVKEKITGVCIDPFNQLTHDYGKTGGRSDKYLETVLGDFARFAQMNDIYFTIIAHPTKLSKLSNGNYPCPDVFDLADGAMWNNKMDNILVFHKPFMQTEPENPLCEFHSKKIRRQKTVGKRGFMEMDYNRVTRRYEIMGTDYLQQLLDHMNLKFR